MHGALCADPKALCTPVPTSTRGVICGERRVDAQMQHVGGVGGGGLLRGGAGCGSWRPRPVYSTALVTVCAKALWSR
jgi:hypothetical protein